MTRKQDTYERARLTIYHRLFSCAIGKRYGDGHYVAFEGLTTEEPKPGDLVRIESAPVSKWTISWFVDWIDKSWNACLLKSVEDHQIGRWTNIGISVYNRDVIAGAPEFQWNDAQFKLWDWWRSPGKKGEVFLVIPELPAFEGDSVRLQCRIRHGWGEPTTPRTFDNWRKLKKKDLYAFFRESVAEYEARPKPEKSH